MKLKTISLPKAKNASTKGPRVAKVFNHLRLRVLASSIEDGFAIAFDPDFVTVKFVLLYNQLDVYRGCRAVMINSPLHFFMVPPDGITNSAVMAREFRHH
jgi:hypothetical protein